MKIMKERRSIRTSFLYRIILKNMSKIVDTFFNNIYNEYIQRRNIKMSTNSNKKEKGILVALFLIVVLMTVGFAYYTQTLTINGTVTVKATKWLVCYESGDGSYVESANSKAASAHTLGSDANQPTDFSFTVTLNKPGDFYEATVKAHNYGSFDAELKQVTLSSLTADQAKYLTYTVKYNNGTTYTATTSQLEQAVTGVTLNAGSAHPVTIRVEYVQPDNSSELPTEDQTITVTGKLDYEQVH